MARLDEPPGTLAVVDAKKNGTLRGIGNTLALDCRRQQLTELPKSGVVSPSIVACRRSSLDARNSGSHLLRAVFDLNSSLRKAAVADQRNVQIRLKLSLLAQ